MEMTRCAGGDSLSQGLDLGGYEPSAHGRQAVITSAEASPGRESWNVMKWKCYVDISRSWCTCDAVGPSISLRNRRVAPVAGEIWLVNYA
jgi:hypothetical protein